MCFSRVFPNSDDTLTLRIAYGKTRRPLFFKRPEEIELAYDGIAEKFRQQGQGEYPYVSYQWAKVAYNFNRDFNSRKKLDRDA